MSCKLQNVFLWFLKVSWIARRSMITLLKFGMFWNVLQASRYVSIIFKSLLDCQRRSKKTFLKFGKSWNVLEASKYFSMNSKSLLDCQKVKDNFPEVWHVLECLASFRKCFNFLKVSWIARRSKITFLKCGKSWNVLQASEYFSMLFKSFLDCQNVQDNFPEVWQVLECLASFQIFFYEF